jgi:para-aminobenzoate synthetase component 1
MRIELPLVVELRPAPDVAAAFLRLAGYPRCLLLDSAQRELQLGRYSFLTACPFEHFAIRPDEPNGLDLLDDRLSVFRTPTIPNLPPFQGGAAGLLSYELGRSLEQVSLPRIDDFQFPSMAIGLYDTVIAFDHTQHRAWLISHGFPETEPTRRLRLAEERIEQFQGYLGADPAQTGYWKGDVVALAEKELAPQIQASERPEITTNFSKDDYLAAVQKAIDYIHAGDIFQVNLSQRLLTRAADSAVSLYLRLRQCNPAPFAGWFSVGDGTTIVSASPERFLSLRGGRVEARPIKGTRRRTTWAEADLFAGDDLLQSEKDRAENVMIVDLLRNDLSRVCDSDSVRVTQLCGLETYQFVQHLVSAVEGTLSPGKTAVDLVRAAFPGGSITGAPKIRAMEIIAELEPTARGPYCGSLGYFGFDGSMDLSILIRTITASRGWWQFPVGGGIVAQSSPEREYEETWHKAEGILRALRV